MRSAVVILSMVAVIAAEAPYHLPRPASHAPPFSYPAAPAPHPPPPPLQQHPHHYPHPHPQPQFIQYPPQSASAPQFIQGSGYHYQPPHIAPALVQSAPQTHPPPPIIPYPQAHYAQPPPQPIPQSPPSYTYAQPAPALRPQAPPALVQPLPAYIAPQPAPVAAPLPAYAAPQTQSPPLGQHVSHYQPQIQQGYAYQQPQIQYVSHLPLQAQPLQAQPLQTQPLNNNVATSALSSYQADANQYNSAQSHGETLDATVVDRVQNIIKDNEHTSARDAGYQSLVSGVSLEQARPSIEISSFVHNSPLQTSQSSEHGSIEQPSSRQLSASEAGSAPSQDYGLPTVATNSLAPATAPHSDAALSFLPQNKPATSYGSPQ